MDYNYVKLTVSEKEKFRESTVLITGCGGFSGYYFLHFFNSKCDQLGIKKVIGLENFLTGTRDWLEEIAKNNPIISIFPFDVINDNLNEVASASEANIIIHGASIASPTFYRIYPLETIDANIIGLRRLLDFFVKKTLKASCSSLLLRYMGMRLWWLLPS